MVSTMATRKTRKSNNKSKSTNNTNEDSDEVSLTQELIEQFDGEREAFEQTISSQNETIKLLNHQNSNHTKTIEELKSTINIHLCSIKERDARITKLLEQLKQSVPGYDISSSVLFNVNGDGNCLWYCLEKLIGEDWKKIKENTLNQLQTMYSGQQILRKVIMQAEEEINLRNTIAAITEADRWKTYIAKKI